MNEDKRPAKANDEQVRRSGSGGPIPAKELNEDQLREAEHLGDGSPALESRGLENGPPQEK
jgi:hypothetical protein